MHEKYPEHCLLGEEDVEWGKDIEVFTIDFFKLIRRQSMQLRIRSGCGLLILWMERLIMYTVFR